MNALRRPVTAGKPFTLTWQQVRDITDALERIIRPQVSLDTETEMMDLLKRALKECRNNAIFIRAIMKGDV